jgi:outer membrane biosynthesis protein TonB
MVGVFIGSKGRAVSLAILESSGLERLDKLVLRCLYRANFTPATRDKAPLQWIFKTSLEPKRTTKS